MQSVTIFHNPRCGKSREALKLLEEHKIHSEVVKYLETPPTFEELKIIIQKLNIHPLTLIRTKETLFKELKLQDEQLTDDEWIKIMVDHPKLIERPIIIDGNRAIIGRPIEKVIEFIQSPM